MISIEELGHRVATGHLLVVGEVRAADVRQKGFVDKKSGLAATTWIVTFFVERSSSQGFEIAQVTKRVPEGTKDCNGEPLATLKGRIFAFEVESVERKPGILMVRMADREPVEVVKDRPASAAPQGAADGGQ